MIRFTIRDLLWLTVVAALGVGWSINRNELDRERVKAQRKQAEFEQTLSSAYQNADRWKGIANDLAGIMRDTGWHVEINERGWTIAKPQKSLSDSTPNP